MAKIRHLTRTIVPTPVDSEDAANKGYVDTAVSGGGGVSTHEGATDPHPQYLTASEGNAAYAPSAHAHAPTIVSLSNVSNGNNISVNASQGSMFRVTTTGAGATLTVPSNPTDGVPINIEILANVALSLVLNSSIQLTSGITTPIAVAAGKRLFLGLRPVGTTWYLLASSVQS